MKNLKRTPKVTGTRLFPVEVSAHALIRSERVGEFLGNEREHLERLGRFCGKSAWTKHASLKHKRASVAMRRDNRIVSAILLRKRIILCGKWVAITQVASQMLWQCVAM